MLRNEAPLVGGVGALWRPTSVSRVYSPSTRPAPQGFPPHGDFTVRWRRMRRPRRSQPFIGEDQASSFAGCVSFLPASDLRPYRLAVRLYSVAKASAASGVKSRSMVRLKRPSS
jgi:hypothetical protein